MPLYEVVLEQRYANQLTVNRWNYMGSGVPAAVTPSFALLSAMGFISNSTTLLEGTVGSELQDLQNAGVEFVQATARAIYIDEDFYGGAFPALTVGTGSAAATGLSPADAYGFRSNRVKQSIGRGFKRFVGVGDGLVGQYGVLSSEATDQMQLLAEAMGETLTFDDEGNTLTFVPTVVQKEKYVTPSGKSAYRYYATELLQAPHLAQGINWELYNTTRTQVSRQYSRGQ